MNVMQAGTRESMNKPSLENSKVVPAISEIAAQDWNACANPVALSDASAVGDGGRVATPASACTHHFMATRISCRGGAFPIRHRPHRLARHNTSSRNARTAVSSASMPCYLKSHSRGEYVFDRGWAEAYENAGGRGYSKLQVSVPSPPPPAHAYW